MAAHSVEYTRPQIDEKHVDYEFTAAELEAIQKHVAKYPDKTSAVMPALWIAQEKFGVLSTGAIELVAHTLGLPPSHVYGVATFYTQYLKRPVPEVPFHLLEFCTCFTCGECGGREMMDYATQKLGCDAEGMSADRRFWVREAECLGACDTPVVVQIDNRRMAFHVDKAKFDAIVKGLEVDQVPDFESVPAITHAAN